MMKTAITILLMAFCLSAGAQTMADTLQYKPYTDSTGNYLISYRYNPDFADIPATYPPGKPHYDAVVTVFEINESDTTQVYQPLRGVYVQGSCTCYDPAKIVDRHRKLNKAE